MTRQPALAAVALFAALCVVVTVWASIDRHPPEWDYANHLERALECHRTLANSAADRFGEIMGASAFYPPLAICAAGALYFAFPVTTLTALAVMLLFLGVAMFSVYGIGRIVADPTTGLLAAFFVGTAPFVVYSLLNFQLDLPLMAMVALALNALIRTERFSRPGWTAALGLVWGLGLLTKPTFPVYALAPLLWTAGQAAWSGGRWRRFGWLGLAGAIAVVVALPWYRSRLLGLPLQFMNRSFKFAEQEGVNTVLRGLRAVSDFEYEFQMANMNRKLAKEIETLFMMTGEDYFYISSRFVRDVARLGGDVTGLVPPNVLAVLKKRFK